MSERAVLIVDDDPFIRKLVATTLQDVSGFVLHQAADGAEAVERAAEVEPAIVFLDIDMPNLDGISACARIREGETGHGATIVMLTAAGGDDVEERARRAGADLFLTKPFSPLELLQLVDQLGRG